MTSDALIRPSDPLVGDPNGNGFRRHPVAAPPAEELEQLRAALVSNRRISMAMGILMIRRNLDEEQAFSYLRRVSQDSNRKLRDVAEDVIRHRRVTPGSVHPSASAGAKGFGTPPALPRPTRGANRAPDRDDGLVVGQRGIPES